MLIFPAIDLYEGCAVRLYKGDYEKKTIYSENPVEIAIDFKEKGAECMHLVDLEGARYGTTPNIELIKKIKSESGLFTEVGGGIRSEEVVEAYISSGIDRVILGTAAVNDQDFLIKMTDTYGDKIAVGVDIKDGFVAIKGWTEKSMLKAEDFISKLNSIHVKTVICTDISKDGAMQGSNNKLYTDLNARFKDIDFIASGGVSAIDDVVTLRKADMYGAIIGKAYYTGAIDLRKAIEVAS